MSVFAITLVLNSILYATGGYASSWAMVLLTAQMFIPGLAALIFIREEGKSPRDYGLRFGGLRYYLLAYVVVLGTHLLHSLVAAGAGLGELLPPAEGFEKIAPGFEMSTWVILLLVFVAAPIQNLVFGLGEEFGWRGYLLEKMRGAGLTRAILIIGTIWGVWHAPIILMGHNFPEDPYLGAVFMTLTCIPLGAIFTWLRLKSDSAVVAGFAHGTFNATLFLGGIFHPTSGLLWTNPMGPTGLLVFALVATSLFRFFPVDFAKDGA